MLQDPKALVAAGYDRIAQQYLRWPAGRDIRLRYLARLMDLVPDGGRVLDLGCGAGIPVACELSRKATVMGIDISPRQIELARQNVPAARFIVGDMMAVELPRNHFDAIAAFFSITHLPRGEHAALVQRAAHWLRSGGIFLASTGASAADAVEPDWLGVPMFFSHFDAATNLDIVRAAGLEMREHKVVSHHEDGRAVQFLWLIAQKPAAGP